MNAGERLWRALGEHDWDGVRAQFHPAARIEWHESPGGSVTCDLDEVIARHRAEGADAEVVRTVADGRYVVVEGRVGRRRGVGVYDLHEGRIAGASEYWVLEPA